MAHQVVESDVHMWQSALALSRRQRGRLQELHVIRNLPVVRSYHAPAGDDGLEAAVRIRGRQRDRLGHLVEHDRLLGLNECDVVAVSAIRRMRVVDAELVLDATLGQQQSADDGNEFVSVAALRAVRRGQDPAVGDDRSAAKVASFVAQRHLVRELAGGGVGAVDDARVIAQAERMDGAEAESVGRCVGHGCGQ